MKNWLSKIKQYGVGSARGLYSVVLLIGAIIFFPVEMVIVALDRSKVRKLNKKELQELFEIEMEEAHQESIGGR